MNSLIQLQYIQLHTATMTISIISAINQQITLTETLLSTLYTQKVCDTEKTITHTLTKDQRFLRFN